MNKTSILGIVVGFVSTLIMIFLTKAKVYKDVEGNILVVILLLFTMSMIGYGIAKLFVDGVPKKKKKNKKDDFILNDDQIGGRRL